MRKIKEKTKSFLKDFKEFATKGNILDLAVGVIIGGAFGKIVSSLVADIILPLVGLVMGRVNISELKYVITPAVIDATTGAVEKAEAALLYGNFIQTILDFLIIAFSVFLMLRLVMKAKDTTNKATAVLKKQKDEGATEAEAEIEEEVAPPVEETLESERIVKVLEEIKELLKTANKSTED